MMDVYSVMADPNRRRIMDRLLVSEASVNDLVGELRLSQPLISKHLRVLRESGLARSRIAGQRRIYSLNGARLLEVDAWLAEYRRLWESRIDDLSVYPDSGKEEGTSS